MPKAVLTINSRNYGAWSMRCWLLCRLSSLGFEERIVDADDASTRAELLQLSPSFLVPSLEIGDVKVWDTLAIAEFLNETVPECGLLPDAGSGPLPVR
jgi:glutathione S-transferase